MSNTPELGPLTALSDALSGLVTTTAPAVVAVRSRRARSSGFVWKPGLVVTTDEGLADEGEISIAFAGGGTVPASIVGRDPTTDIALLRADTGDAAPAVFGGTVPAAGTLTIAVGALEGRAVAALGIVAHTGPAWRSMRGGDIDARVELDLSLRSRGEGGLVLNAAGDAYGMAVFGPRRRVLVIPAATIARVARLLETDGKVARGYLGLGLQPVRLDRTDGIGAMVVSVDANGPGASAGIHQGDVIATWNGEPIHGIQALLRQLGPASKGSTIDLAVRRGGETRSVALTIGERPDG